MSSAIESCLVCELCWSQLPRGMPVCSVRLLIASGLVACTASWLWFAAHDRVCCVLCLVQDMGLFLL